MKASKTFGQLKRERGLVDTRDYRPSPSKRGYNRRWKVLRLAFLMKNPLCVECNKHGITQAATQVDHIIPHKGDKKLMYDWNNLQGLCATCHSRKTAKEDGGFGNEQRKS